MRIREFPNNDSSVLLTVIAAYAVGAMIVLSVVIATAVWPAVSGAF